MSLKKIIVIRHAQSEEDINPNLNGEKKDILISITERGKHQVVRTIERIEKVFSGIDSIRIYLSPSNRVLQTTSILYSKLGLDNLGVFVDPRIRNLNWGDVTPENIKKIEEERYKVGVLHYQFPNGDYSPTFVRRIGYFVEELLILGKQKRFPKGVIIVTHGFAMRIITKFLLQMSDEDFRWIKNPPNCYIADFQIDDFNNIKISKSLPCREPL